MFEEGEEGESLFIVKQGCAIVEKGGFEVAQYQVGDHFGERALVKGGLRTATVRADGAVECLRLGQGPFHELMSQCAHVAALFAEQEQVYAQAQGRMTVICPDGVEPGQLIELETPSGELVQVAVPEGVEP
eukprot:COSAG06_NODE_41208_length_393_cov_4.588435_1_plen_130_part_11